jgi:hypothetical protein
MEGRGVHAINALRSMLAAADLCCNHTVRSPQRPSLQHLLK